MVDKKEAACPITGLDRSVDIDRNDKFPIDTEQYIRADWSYINIPSDFLKDTDKAPDYIEDRIVKAWEKETDKSENNNHVLKVPADMPFKATVKTVESPPLPSD